MDWNTTLFAARWIIIGLFYFVLLVLLVGVYRDASARLKTQPGEGKIAYGRLRVIHPGSDERLSAGTLLELKPVTNLGARQDNDIVLGDQYVSGHHFSLRWDGAVWWIQDLNSKNGTLVNQKPVETGRPRALTTGAVIEAGDMVMELID